ncbi:MAG: DUF4364 family protein [Candidatus Bathyarchaeota archaeon]|nr:DUF4364 family protein [Candidatus Bathyarchaeum tardum]WGM88477.1 MAG: DUF4364 family protein [Candidatus Bathyarchaeum tardum]
MGKHRSRLRIVAKILSVVDSNNGAKKTQIMYQAYLSYSLLVQYLNDVTESGLIICGKKNCYEITPKGKKFLTKFNEYAKSQANVTQQLNYIEHQRKSLEKMCPNTELSTGNDSPLLKVVKQEAK